MSKATKTAASQKSEEVPGTGLLSKALNILECVGESGRRPRIKAIVEATGYSKPTIYRILSALSARGFVQVDPRDHAYSLGPRFTELAGAVAQHSDLISISAAAMKRIADKYGEAVSLGVIAGSAQQTIAYREGRGGLSPSSIGVRKPLYCTALGKALLGFQHPADRDRIVNAVSFDQLTEFTLGSEAALKEDLAAIRMRGFALDNEEIVLGVKCVAVPILNEYRQAVAALSVSAPAHRMTERRRHEIALELSGAAQEIGAALNGFSIEGPSAGVLPKGLSRVDGFSGFGLSQILTLPDGSVAVCDGPGGAIYRYGGDGVEHLKSFAAAVNGACLVHGTMLAVAGDGLWRFDPEQSPADHPPVKLSDGAVFAIGEGLVAHHDQIWLAAGEQVLRLAANGRTETVFEDRVPGTGFALGVHGPVVMTRKGLVEIDPATGRGTLRFPLSVDGVRAFAIAPDGGLWIARSEQWAVERFDPAGQVVDRVPIPAPTVSTLHFSRSLLVGTERWSLSAAQLDLAPMAGSLFLIDPSRFAASHGNKLPREGM